VSQTFRTGRAEEVSAVVTLLMNSFPTPGRDRAFWEGLMLDSPFGGTESWWVGEDGGRPAAFSLLHRFRQWIGGAALPVMGLGGVAISPTHRRRGLASRMVEAGFRHALERGDVASALYPFRITFYQGLGYGEIGEAHQYLLPPAAFPDDREALGRLRLVTGDADRAEMRAVYDRWIRTQTGQMERPERAWRRPFAPADDQAGVLVLDAAGKPEGYVIVRYRPDLPVERRFLEVEEAVWETPDAQRAVYAWIHSLADQHALVAYRAHPDEDFGERVREPRLPAGSAPPWQLWAPRATLLRGPMFRLLDVAKAWEMRTAHPDVSTSVLLEVEDGQIAENRGPWLLRVEGGRVSVEPARGGGAADASLRTTVETLSRIYAADLTARRAVRVGRATGDGAALAALDRALALPRPWMFERF
jgi:predicted acetyltransferase